MAARIARWEAELWSYMTSGNGEHCPVYSRCQVRRRGGFCYDDERQQFQRMLAIGRSISGNYEVALNDADFIDFMQRWTPGRIFILVERLAKKFLKQAGVSGPPVPTKLILSADENNPVEVHLLPLKAHHGAIWGLKDRWVIQLNENDTRAVRRMTLFHEAFHILAHSGATPVFKILGNKRAYFNELLADYFAVNVLTPREWVTEKWTEVNNVNRMARIFDVAEPHMWLRLKQLRLI